MKPLARVLSFLTVCTPCLFVLSCSSDASGPSSEIGDASSANEPDGGTLAPPSSASDAATSDASPNRDASTEKDAAISHSQSFELTLNGERMVPKEVNVETKRSGGVDKHYVNAWFDTGDRFGSQSEFSIITPVSEIGPGECGEGRSAMWFYKDDDGTLRWQYTENEGGHCTMTITSNGADGYVSGNAKGVIGGITAFSFDVRWDQPVPTP